MTVSRKLNIIFGILSSALLVTLLFKLTTVPGGMILSGLHLGVMYITGLILACLVISGILKLIFKKASFLMLLFITTGIAFIGFHYRLYSPALTIVVPNGYTGEINLILSNIEDNILTVDSNGVGYLNEWTFNKTYTRPVVVQADGKNLDKNLIGFNPSTFFGKGKMCCIEGKQIETLNFEIVPDGITEKQYYPKDWTISVNKELVLFAKPDDY